MERTPYSAGPYGERYASSLGPNDSLMKEGYIFVTQDVRGRYRSQGINLEVTPHIAKKKSNKDVDESSDTYDTIDWLIKNTNNNGRVGIHGISYPGFYATASLPDAHPALKAVSPQAPVTDEFMGDDANHNGAFFLMDNFSFMSFFDNQWNEEKKAYNPPNFVMKQRDAYKFYLNMKTIAATNSDKYYAGKGRIWNEYLANDTYNEYWKSRNIRTHLKNIKVPTMVVGGWFDAEDLFGALKTFEAIDKNNPTNKTHLVMGPWTHGAWGSENWNKYATHQFGSNTSKYYQDNLETSFFNFYLKDKGTFTATKATVFETGTNTWKSYNTWPPTNVTPTPYYLQADGTLSTNVPASVGATEYISDPNKPVPYSQWISPRRSNEYMADDQRFTAQRPDVVVFESEELTNDVTLSGSIIADLKVSITGTDADFIVKLIDVLPDTTSKPKDAPNYLNMAGFQRLVRAEVMRGKFRNSFEKPTAFIPNKKETVKFNLNDVAHTFKKGHKIMVQVQSSWFPLVDRNPQQFMNIPKAKETDFKKATIKIFSDSYVVLPILN
jgi:putative CocE/NonD family hydrolase